MKMLTEELINSGRRPDYTKTLIAALDCAYPNNEIVSWLLENGADVNHSTEDGTTPLHAAAAKGYDTIVKILLDANADVNIVSQNYGTALQAAACQGREPGSLCLERSISGQQRYGDYVTDPFRRYPETFHLLLSANADINIRGGRFGNALQAAAYAGNVEAVQELLARNVDFNAHGGFYESALQAAACGEAQDWWKFFPELEPGHHLTVVTLLLDAGADANVSGGFFGTSLQAAAYSCNLAVVRALLNAGAKVVVDGRGYYGNPISAGLGFGKALLIDCRPSLDYFTPEVQEITDILIRCIDDDDVVTTCQSVIVRETERDNKRGLSILKDVLQSILDDRGSDGDDHSFQCLIDTLPNADQSTCEFVDL